MVQYIKQGNIFGRIGTGIGQGLAEQLPKEIERGRLSAGLRDLEQQQGLTPFQQFSRLSAIPGITPQMVQSGTDLLRQQAQAQAFNNFNAEQNKPKPNPFSQENRPKETTSTIPSLTKEEDIAKIQEGFIPRTEDEKFKAAGDRYNRNPAAFPNGPQQALDYENQVDATNRARAEAFQKRHENLSHIQDNVVTRLKDQYERLSGGNKSYQVPPELYSRIEDEAIQATKPKAEGGRGLTEQQAMKEYGDKLNDASRDYAKIKEIGNWGITLRPAKDTLQTMKALQQKMEKLGESDNYAKQLITEKNLSPKFAYAIAQPVSKVAPLQKYIKDLPDIRKTVNTGRGYMVPSISQEESTAKTLEIAPVLAKILSEEDKASPQAIAYEIEKKGYNPSVLMNYLTDHASDVNLRQRQIEQIETPLNPIGTWNDWWLSSFSGLD